MLFFSRPSQAHQFSDVRKRKGKKEYFGHNIDLLNRLAQDIGFNFTIHEPADGRYGSEVNGRWTGLIGELLEGVREL